MAQNFLDFAKNKHAVAGSSRLTAVKTGEIYNVKITEDLDNGSIIGLGDREGNDYYKQAAATTFTGKIVEQAANGNYYVEVLTADNAYLVLQVPLTYYEFSTSAKAESTFYNEKGDIVRVYKLAPHDIFEISIEGIDATAATAGIKVGTTTVKVSKNKVTANA